MVICFSIKKYFKFSFIYFMYYNYSVPGENILSEKCTVFRNKSLKTYKMEKRNTLLPKVEVPH